MDDQKQAVARAVVQKCLSWATAEQRQLIESAVILALAGVKVEKEETALSTEFAQPNDKYLQQFLAIKMIKGLSERTLEQYRREVQVFLDFAQKPVPAIGVNDIRVYLAKKKVRDGCSNTSVDNTRRYLRSFFDTMWREGVIADNPAAKIDEIKKEKKVKKPFSEEEVEAIREACRDERDRALVEVLYSTGCRVSEVAGMNWSGIDGDQITVLGKGSKERTVYLNTKASRALKKYLATRKDDQEALFVGTREPHSRLSAGCLEAIVKQLGRAANVPDCHPHRFRRTAATVALNRGMPIDQVSKMLGHENLSTTQIYAKTDAEDVHHSHKKYLT